MTVKLCLLCCCNFYKEIDTAVNSEGWDDVAVAAFPARCGRPPVNWDELRPLLPEKCTHIVVLGAACTHGLGEPPADFSATRIVRVKQCFQLVAGEHLVAEAVTGGAYLITPAWLADWRGQLKTMGFAPDQAGKFFQDFARELVLLDTGIDPQISTHLSELQAAVQLPVRRIAIGLDHTRLLLARLVLEWRLEQCQHTAQTEGRRHASERADHVAAMDMLVQLAKAQQEPEAITTIKELFNMLFAPEAVYYLRVEKQMPIADKPIPGELLQKMQNLASDYAWTPDGNGFLLRIMRGEDVLGLVTVDRLTFPKYRERYLNMALALIGVCGLAIENARNRRSLMEAEKMASLGTVVAGVAHEINTPLGVSLTAASMLQEECENLAAQFAGRTMTQSGLNTYLARAQEEAALICANLERIGKLVAAFRLVAVGGKPLKRQLFRLKDCLDEVIRSMGHLLAAERVTLKIACDPFLLIESLPDDWPDIFRNLIDNSLKHGFKEREHGDIVISISTTAQYLHIEYKDDGVGLTPEVQTRIFDPFFTTDMQHGMGLGMHLIYNLITHRMGGTIHCTSQPGQGVCYHIEVPR